MCATKPFFVSKYAAKQASSSPNIVGSIRANEEALLVIIFVTRDDFWCSRIHDDVILHVAVMRGLRGIWG